MLVPGQDQTKVPLAIQGVECRDDDAAGEPENDLDLFSLEGLHEELGAA